MYDTKNLSKLKKLSEPAAVALTTQCLDCMEIHANKARKAGATEQELAEPTLIAAALRAGGASPRHAYTRITDRIQSVPTSHGACFNSHSQIPTN
jgi:AhpD family alkylhydroperoxidase